MGWDYVIVHLKYTIPPAFASTFLYWPLFSDTDVYKLLVLITIATVSTIPWDSYLIREHVWSYPGNSVIGWTLYRIPLEELFFFIIQTYTTTLLYLILSRPVFQYAYLDTGLSKMRRFRLSSNSKHRIGQILLFTTIILGVYMINIGGKALYMGLILSWAGPFLLLLWSLAGRFISNLPATMTLLPICLPTVYLWMVDTFALKRGTWVISPETKSGLYLWNHLELEEAVFFLVTNSMIVLGLLAFDNALAILYAFPTVFPSVSGLPSPAFLIKALLLPTRCYDFVRLSAFKDAIRRLQRKSRSFSLASAAFQGGLVIDMVQLYSYCRVADDLIDNAARAEEAKAQIENLYQHLDAAFSEHGEGEVNDQVKRQFPLDMQLALINLPYPRLSKEPLLGLLKGFEIDLAFLEPNENYTHFPIKTEMDLETYGSCVAGTVAELCLDLVFYYYPKIRDDSQAANVRTAGHNMGIALQLINIARDISTDASMGRVYIPNTWLDEHGLTPEDVLQTRTDHRITKLRCRLLKKAFKLYQENIHAIEQLPKEVRGPMRAVVESYIEIGEVLGSTKDEMQPGKATVSRTRRISVAWKAMNRPLSRDLNL